MGMKATLSSSLGENVYYAHTSGATGEWQPLSDHLHAVAKMARGFAKLFGAGNLAYWAGLLHDLGKFNPSFQRYLYRSRECS